LLTAQAGRLVVLDPKAVAWVNYLVVGDALIVRIGAESATTGCPRHSPVTLDVDAFDVFSQVGWSVHVRGEVERIGGVDVDRLREAAGTDPPPWTGHSDGRWFRISPTDVSGRWFRPPERPCDRYGLSQLAARRNHGKMPASRADCGAADGGDAGAGAVIRLRDRGPS
jgi:hypothetical protein